jgi:hypothetical protein
MEYNYKIRAEDLIFAEEFRRKPIGHHSPGLQRVLTRFRGAPVKDKHVLLCVKPHREWMLAQLSGVQGKPLRLHKNKRFTSIEAAEWAVFCLRWKQHTGKDLERELKKLNAKSRGGR